jgi:hypothetical protein
MSDERKQAAICGRRVEIEIVLPECHARDILDRARDRFEVTNNENSSARESKIGILSYDPNGWHLVATLTEEQEAPFLDFVCSFCKQNNIQFNDPRVPPLVQEMRDFYS